jgi:hypothetical protein
METDVLLTNRELATAILICTTILVCLIVPRIRRYYKKSALGVLAALFQWKIVAYFSGLVVWAAVLVFVGWQLGWWNLALTLETVFVLVSVGFPMLGRAATMESGALIIRRSLRDVLGPTALFLFYVNLESFPLGVELILQVVAVFLAILAAVLGANPNAQRAARNTASVLGILVIASAVWTTVQVIMQLGQTDWWEVLRLFLTTLLLPVSLIPYYYLAAFSSFAETNILMAGAGSNPKPKVRATLAYLIGLRLSVKWASRWRWNDHEILQSPSFRDGLRRMRNFRAAVRAADQAEAERLAALDRFAGVEGVDAEGAQLDRREFQLTKDTMEEVWLQEIGIYQSNGDRFSREAALGAVTELRFSWSNPDSFVVEVSEDGQMWRCWRQMPSGSFLAVGAPERYGEKYYQGARPPTTWPDTGEPEWVDANAERWPPDWEKIDKRPW